MNYLVASMTSMCNAVVLDNTAGEGYRIPFSVAKKMVANRMNGVKWMKQNGWEEVLQWFGMLNVIIAVESDLQPLENKRNYKCAQWMASCIYQFLPVHNDKRLCSPEFRSHRALGKSFHMLRVEIKKKKKHVIHTNIVKSQTSPVRTKKVMASIYSSLHLQEAVFCLS